MTSFAVVGFLFYIIMFFALYIVLVRASRHKPSSGRFDWTCPNCKCEINKQMESEHPLGKCQICGYDLRAGRSSLRVRLWRRWAPELELFLPHERERALRWDPGDGLPIDRQTALSMAAMTTLPFVAMNHLAPFLCSALPLPPWVVYIIVFVMTVGVSCWLWSLTRGRVRRKLRQQLIHAGFAICGPCGYDLRGTTEPRCPECGAPFGEQLLIDTTVQNNDSGQHENSE